MTIKTKTYTVSPTNSLDEAKTKYDWAYSWLSDKNTPIKPQEGKKDIELINFSKSISTEDALKEIASRGYEPAPANYLLTLGIEYPEVLKEKKYIVSLDEANLLPVEFGLLSFLRLYWGGRRRLSLATRAGGWGDHWWFAVIRKPLNPESPKNLDTLTLERAIEICKENGLVVIKEM